jgi:hypothetical protein
VRALRRAASIAILLAVTAAFSGEVATVVAPESADAASTACVLGCATAPAASAPSVSFTGVQAATFSATVNPGEVSTEYGFSYEPTAETSSVVAEPTQTLAASNSTDPVSWSVSGLIPGESYAVSISAENANGTSRGGPTNISVPLAPATPIRLTLTHGDQVGSDSDPGLVGHVAGADPATGVLLQMASKLTGPFKTVSAGLLNQPGPPTPGTNISWSIGPDYLLPPDDLNLFEHNVDIRLESTGAGSYGTGAQSRQVSYSPVVAVYANPTLTVRLAALALDGDPLKPSGTSRLDVSFNEAGSATAISDRPPVDVYRRVGRIWRRILVLNHHASSDDWYVVFPTNSIRVRGTFLMCISRPISEVLSSRFHFSACGRARLSGENGPAGSEYIDRPSLSNDAALPIGVYG